MILFPIDTPTMTTMFSPTLRDMTHSQDESAMNYARPALNTGTPRTIIDIEKAAKLTMREGRHKEPSRMPENA
jgi:hypothetical protein